MPVRPNRPSSPSRAKPAPAAPESTRARLAEVVAAFSGVPLVVVGDLVVDEYVYGRTQRVSREAPVLIVRHDADELRPGAAANAAANCAALGARTRVLGLVGDDAMGKALVRLLRARGVVPAGIAPVPGRVTARKTRVLAGDLHTTRQQVLRVDREGGGRADAVTEAKLRTALDVALLESRALLLSDYGDGVFHPELVAEAVRFAARRGVVVADSRHNVGDYRGVPWVTPNEPEAMAALGMDIESDDDARAACARLLRLTRGEGVLLTRGARGLALARKGAPTVLLPPFGGVEVADVTGAGDTVAATFTLALSAGARPFDAALLANMAGGLVVAKRGTATLTQAELLGALPHLSDDVLALSAAVRP